MQPNQDSPLPYQSVDERFVLLRKLGEGVTGDVFAAQDAESKQEVALKIAKTGTFADFKREFDIARDLRHDGTLRMRGYNARGKAFSETGTLHRASYIVSDLAEGGELFDYLRSKHRFTEQETKEFFKQVLETVEHIHSKGYAHRDLKLENLLLNKERNKLFVADFGHAEKCQCKNDDYNPRRGGTTMYLPPEYHSKKVRVTHPYSSRTSDALSKSISSPWACSPS